MIERPGPQPGDERDRHEQEPNGDRDRNDRPRERADHETGEAGAGVIDPGGVANPAQAPVHGRAGRIADERPRVVGV